MYQYNGGHFSTIVAYNEKEDMVLVMDVAEHLGSWFWVDLTDFYKSMLAIEVEDYDNENKTEKNII